MTFPWVASLLNHLDSDWLVKSSMKPVANALSEGQLVVDNGLHVDVCALTKVWSRVDTRRNDNKMLFLVERVIFFSLLVLVTPTYSEYKCLISALTKWVIIYYMILLY